MTYSIKNIAGVYTARPKSGFWGTNNPLFGSEWKTTCIFKSFTLDDLWTFTFGCYLGHALEFLSALLCHSLFFSDPAWLTTSSTLTLDWILPIVGFHLLAGFVFCSFWHYMTYISSHSSRIHHAKFNPDNQYEPKTGKVGFLTSSTGHLEVSERAM